MTRSQGYLVLAALYIIASNVTDSGTNELVFAIVAGLFTVLAFAQLFLDAADAR